MKESTSNDRGDSQISASHLARYLAMESTVRAYFHELRNVLYTLQYAIENMQDKVRGSSDLKLFKAVGDANDRTILGIRLLNEIFELFRHNEEESDYRLNDAVNSAVMLVSALAASRGIPITTNLDPMLSVSQESIVNGVCLHHLVVTLLLEILRYLKRHDEISIRTAPFGADRIALGVCCPQTEIASYLKQQFALPSDVLFAQDAVGIYISRTLISKMSATLDVLRSPLGDELVICFPKQHQENKLNSSVNPSVA